MFANTYLQKNMFVPRIRELPHSEVGIVIVVPCFREPDVISTLQSVSECLSPSCQVETIVLVNHSESAPATVKQENLNTRHELDKWMAGQSSPHIKYFALGPVALRKKWAGAGLARKYGMDEAIVRFNYLRKPEGIIVSLDADTLVEKNYLVEIQRYFGENPASVGATIAFSHQTEGLEEKHLQGILLYEKYMYYYKKALGLTGYPYPMFTLGSAFAVRAGAYVKRGGMNRRQAGEDFYFLQNLVQVGRVGEIYTTTVHPSARLSNRVPFGTGPVLKKWMDGDEDISKTFNFSAFTDLKIFFDQKDYLYRMERSAYESLLSDLPNPVSAFLEEDDFYTELQNLSKNCASVNAFGQRFFYLFNAFKIFKFLNYTHDHFYSKADLISQIEHLTNYKK